MPFEFWILFVLFLPYLVMTGVFITAWLFEKVKKKPFDAPRKTVAVIVPARDEEDNLSRCLDSLMRQDYDKSLFTVIVAENGSSDQTLQIAREYASCFKNIKVLHIKNLPDTHGKKAAITRAVDATDAALIFLTDADCTHSRKWISTMVARMEGDHLSMLCSPVIPRGERGILSKWFQLEHLSLMVSGGASILAGIPLMCSAAGMAFRREDFIAVEGYKGYESLSSGDDVFLMFKFRKENRKTGFIKSVDAMVETATPKSPGAFINQRLRWSSKTRYYPSVFAKAAALSVLSASLTVIASVLLYFWLPEKYLILLLVPALKFLADFLLLSQASLFAGRAGLMIHFIPVFLVYPFYVLTVALLTLTVKASWKNTMVGK